MQTITTKQLPLTALQARAQTIKNVYATIEHKIKVAINENRFSCTVSVINCPDELVRQIKETYQQRSFDVEWSFSSNTFTFKWSELYDG